MSKRIVIISDTQIPYHHRKALKAVLRFVGDYQPDEVVQIGDLVDYPQPSRWNKDSRGEFEGSVFEDSDDAKRLFLEPLRSVYDGPVKVFEGNHDERPRVYAEKYAPALARDPRRSYHFDVLCDFDGFGVERLPTFYRFAPGWIMTHGHKGGISLNRIAGNTALRAAVKFDKSVIMGHTHRQGILHETRGFDGDGRTLTGVEVGHLMDPKLASKQYLKEGTANWQMGFAVATVDGRGVHVKNVPILSRKFEVDGEIYEV